MSLFQAIAECSISQGVLTLEGNAANGIPEESQNNGIDTSRALILPKSTQSENASKETVGMSSPPISEFAAKTVDQVRLEANLRLNPQRKSELGQFMTPVSVANFMASLFSPASSPIRLLDAGAGVGSLTDAFINRWGKDNVSVSAYEVDPTLISYLRQTLHRFGNGTFHSSLITRDFIEDAAYKITLGTAGPGFTHAILNPPYKKINSDSAHRALLRAVGLETVNLYTAFVGLALQLMAKHGEIVAIIPRSFCNGLYYKPFRQWVLERSSIEQIHLFHSRTSAFNDDEVLQENVIIKLVAGKPQGDVTITTSSDTTFSDLESHSYPFAEIVHDLQDQSFIHIPASPTQTGQNEVPLAAHTLEEIGLEVSTGPVVDFRLKDFLRDRPDATTVPLLYPTHFVSGLLEWPRISKKPNALVHNSETQKWLYPSGFYTVVRRFSSKEERRRVMANVVDPTLLNSNEIAFENHLNVFHAAKKGLSADIARGLAVFLNSSAVDDFFRRFSGHTQVNATDLRLLKYPSRADLESLGQWAQSQPILTQESMDQHIQKMHGKTRQDR